MKAQSSIITFTLIATICWQMSGVGTKVEAQQPGSADPIALYKKTGINKDQESKLRQLTGESEKVNKPKIEELERLAHDMRGLALQLVPDEKMAIDKQERINKLNGELTLDRIRLTVKMRKILTREQRIKLVESIKQTSMPRMPLSPKR